MRERQKLVLKDEQKMKTIVVTEFNNCVTFDQPVKFWKLCSGVTLLQFRGVIYHTQLRRMNKAVES